MSRTTIIVSPRERFSSIIESLKSLFDTIPDDIPVIVVEGGTPKHIRDELHRIQTRRNFELVSLPYMITPNEARNIGARKAVTKFLVFSDNDIIYEKNWLTSLEKNAIKHDADLVAPLIFIGPSTESIIHHAGGILEIRVKDGEKLLYERHRFMNCKYQDVKHRLPVEAPVENEVCEFHCLLMRKTFYDQMGGLDERLITREQMDVGLRAKAINAKVTFEMNSHVTYMARVPFQKIDIDYHFFRWSDTLAIRSIKAFQKSWSIKLDENRIRFNWINRHRERAVVSIYPFLHRLIGSNLLHFLFTRRIENRVCKRSLAERPTNLECKVPNNPALGIVEKLFVVSD